MLAESQTHNGAAPIVVRTRNVTTSGFEVRVQEQESEGPHTTETIGYVAIERGRESVSGSPLVIGRTGDAVRGMGGSEDLWGDPNWHSIPRPEAAGGEPFGSYVFLAQQQTADGGDIAGLRKRGAMGTDLALTYWNILTPNGEVIGCQLSEGGRRLYVKAHLGSIRAVLDGTGSVKETRDYYPFGLPMPGRYDKGSPPTKEDYTGHVKDEATGLHYAGARYYSSAFGRWTTTDPILGEKGAKELLKQDARLLTMTSYNYAFGNPATLADPTGMAPLDWFKTKSGKIRYDEDVRSQADLKEGQTYLGENVLKYQEDGPTKLLTEGGDRVKVFDGGATKAEGGAKGASGASVPAAAQKSLLTSKWAKGGKTLSNLVKWTDRFAKGGTVTSLVASTGSEVVESDPIGTYEIVKGAVDAGLAYGSYYYGAGAVAGFALEVTPAGNGLTAKERGIRFLTRRILEAQVDQVVSE